ncbi:hypothetical protein BDZ97DRAFT_1923401 [Flammula alnicola]|nr:hypothetical protein BDZ97DRAFT_1923401 [Flammula alnicola]
MASDYRLIRAINAQTPEHSRVVVNDFPNEIDFDGIATGPDIGLDEGPRPSTSIKKEGILPSGGVALLKASLQLATNSPGSGAGPTSSLVLNDAKPIHMTIFDQEVGVAITRAILNNAGEETTVIVGTLLKPYGPSAWGYDAAKGEYHLVK